MLNIYAKTNEFQIQNFSFENPKEFIKDMDTNQDCMGDYEISLVVSESRVIYSSLYAKAKSFEETPRTIDVYDWFRYQKDLCPY